MSLLTVQGKQLSRLIEPEDNDSRDNDLRNKQKGKDKEGRSRHAKTSEISEGRTRGARIYI